MGAALEASQWLPDGELRRRQFAALGRVIAHAARYSPMFAAHLARAGLSAGRAATPEGFSALPPLGRRDLQADAAEVFCREVPAEHQPTYTASSSGSTGEPVSVRRTAVNRRDWGALTRRMHAWYEVGPGARHCVSRANVRGVQLLEDRAAPAGGPRAGPLLVVANGLAIGEQAAAIARFAPDVLLGYPSVVLGLAEHIERTPQHAFALRQVRTLGETLAPEQRAEIGARWRCAVMDIYSSEETGYIALQCPSSDLYHVMAETLLVEVLDPSGRPCRPGEVGRVVVSDLHNLAMPLIRYDIGDYAEVGGPCSCGRGLRTLARIVGRERNLMLMPDGARRWPVSGRSRFRQVAPVVQYQLVQRTRTEIEARLVVERPLSAREEEALGAIIRQALGHPFGLAFSYFEGRLPVGPRGKFEEFVCRAG